MNSAKKKAEITKELGSENMKIEEIPSFSNTAENGYVVWIDIFLILFYSYTHGVL